MEPQTGTSGIPANGPKDAQEAKTDAAFKGKKAFVCPEANQPYLVNGLYERFADLRPESTHFEPYR